MCVKSQASHYEVKFVFCSFTNGNETLILTLINFELQIFSHMLSLSKNGTEKYFATPKGSYINAILQAMIGARNAGNAKLYHIFHVGSMKPELCDSSYKRN